MLSQRIISFVNSCFFYAQKVKENRVVTTYQETRKTEYGINQIRPRTSVFIEQ